MTRPELARRQQHVLRALLAGEVPDGFDPRSATLTTRVLVTKRRSEATDAFPLLRTVPDFAARFGAWSAQHPRRGCADDDVVDFLADDTGELPEPLASIRTIEQVYRGSRSFARDRRPGQARWVIALRGRVWHLGPRS
ncbi:hypothetical protein [Aeromicrobium sp. 9AM]|uniref:hypothetical protein n=1 Tax=Aeromicrobium sp. 9AM TaxID=2653126 RepID=UPI0012F0A785|nr:hypothetical protein [Aeromicrobium sp. 9AM]VXA98303.1 conserved hypothetical protein [Aeromicrobium sp. 9AM]